VFKIADGQVSFKYMPKDKKFPGMATPPSTNPAPQAPLPENPAPVPVDYDALDALLLAKLGTPDRVAIEVKIQQEAFKGLLSADAAKVALAKKFHVGIPTRVTRTIDTPAGGKSGSSHVEISETTYPAPPSPLCRSPWSEKSNDIRYSSVKFYGDNQHVVIIACDDNVEEIWHLWSHPRLLFVLRKGQWTTLSARGHAGVVWQPEAPAHE